jgi:hypothetical protein
MLFADLSLDNAILKGDDRKLEQEAAKELTGKLGKAAIAIPDKD